MTSRQFAELIEPHARMVETKERARRRWGSLIYDRLSEINLRYGPDMTVSWVETAHLHQIISTIKVTQVPYTVQPDGSVSASGAAIDRLYATNGGFRDPFDPSFDPDLPWGEILPPSSAPLENVLPVWLPRGKFGSQAPGEWFDAEVGGYAVEETYPNEMRDRAVLEMWLQLGEATVYLSQLGEEKIKEVRILTYADPFSQEIFRQYHGIRRKSRVFAPRGNAQLRGSDEIEFANTYWRIVGWFAPDFHEEDRRIQNGKNSRFDSRTATSRRMSLFIPDSWNVNSSLQQNPEVMIRLLESEDGDVYFSAMRNLRHTLQTLELTEGGVEQLAALVPQIEESFGKALSKQIHPIGAMAVMDLEAFVTDFKISLFAPKTIPRWIAKILEAKHLKDDPAHEGEAVCFQDVTLALLYNLVGNPRLDWEPDEEIPSSEKTREFEVRLERFLRSKPSESNRSSAWDVPRSLRSNTLHNLVTLDLTENEVRSALARVFASFSTETESERPD